MNLEEKLITGMKDLKNLEISSSFVKFSPNSSFTALSYCLNRMGYYIDDDASDQSGKSRKCLGGFFASIGLLVGTMAKFTQFLDSKHNVIFFLLQYLDSICRGSGQVSFCENFFFLAGEN
jgi:hypothetical protein